MLVQVLMVHSINVAAQVSGLDIKIGEIGVSASNAENSKYDLYPPW